VAAICSRSAVRVGDSQRQKKRKKRGQTTSELVQLRWPVRKHVRNIVPSELDFNWQRVRAHQRGQRKSAARGFHIFRERLNNGTITILGQGDWGTGGMSKTGYSRWTDSILNRLSTNVPSISN
jgi:hypothetical protein